MPSIWFSQASGIKILNGILYLAGWAKNEIPPDFRIAFETDLIWRSFPIGDSDCVYGYKYLLSISIPKPNTWTRHPFNRQFISIPEIKLKLLQYIYLKDYLKIYIYELSQYDDQL